MTQRGRTGARPAAGGRRSAGPRRDPAAEPRGPVAPRIDLAAARVRVRAVIEPVLAAEGYDLEELAITRAGRRHVVRVLVDTDGGVNLDGVALVSREISRALDASEESDGELLSGEYQLEVGSPGVDRPLTLPRHWRRNVGRLVTVSVEGRSLTGRVTGADDRGVVLDVDGVPREADYPALGPGRVQIEFNRVDEVELDPADDDDDDDFDDDDDDDFDTDGEGEER